MNNLPYFLALNRIKNVGPRTVKKLLYRWPNLKELFELSTPQRIAEGVPEPLANLIGSFDWDLVASDIAWSQNSNQHLLTWESPEYPLLLKEIADPPVVLYAKGSMEALNQPCIAMIGSRNPSVTGAENAFRFAKELAGYGLSIVSGLALGIDAAAHRGTLEGKGRTVAVMGTGINTIYPRSHAKLASDICENGLVLTEFPLNTPPMAGHFPRRNRIISGLSLSTLVVEAAMKSGSLITARMALEQNRDVLAIPGSIHNPLARGCHHLLQQGATLITSVADVIQELNLPLAPNSITKDREKDHGRLASKDAKLVKYIGFETTSIDQIILRSGETANEVIRQLTQLELESLIEAVPGGYIRCVHER